MTEAEAIAQINAIIEQARANQERLDAMTARVEANIRQAEETTEQVRLMVWRMREMLRKQGA